jgi:guanylate cyclase soluble subunit beta
MVRLLMPCLSRASLREQGGSQDSLLLSFEHHFSVIRLFELVNISNAGEYFVSYVNAQGYDRVLMTLGSNLAQFLLNLNNLHLHLSMGMPAMSAPAFRVTEIKPESLKLHYYSKRPGLWPIVKGVLQALAKTHFRFDITLEVIESREAGTNDHEVFLVTFPFQQSMVDIDLKGLSGESIFTIENKMFYKLFPFHMLLDSNLRIIQVRPPSSS